MWGAQNPLMRTEKNILPSLFSFVCRRRFEGLFSIRCSVVVVVVAEIISLDHFLLPPTTRYFFGDTCATLHVPARGYPNGTMTADFGSTMISGLCFIRERPTQLLWLLVSTVRDGEFH